MSYLIITFKQLLTTDLYDFHLGKGKIFTVNYVYAASDHKELSIDSKMGNYINYCIDDLVKLILILNYCTPSIIFDLSYTFHLTNSIRTVLGARSIRTDLPT